MSLWTRGNETEKGLGGGLVGGGGGGGELALLKDHEGQITNNKTEREGGRKGWKEGGEGKKSERKICWAEGKVGENERGSRTCARSAAPLPVTGALQGFFSPLSFDSFISPLFHFEILLHSRDTGLFSLFFLSLSFFHIFLPPRLPLSLSVSLTLSLPGSLSVFLWLATKGWRSEPDVWMNSPNLLWRESRGRRSREEEAEEERYDWSGWRGGKRRALEKCWLLAEDK